MAALVIVTVSCRSPAPQGSVRREPITEGRPAEADEVYATVALIDRAYRSQMCTGTLIAPRVVLTAAHCLFLPEGDTDWVLAAPEELAVVVGALDVTTPSPADFLALSSLTPHEGYIPDGGDWDEDGLGQDNDIGVMVLAEPVTSVTAAAVLSAGEVEATLIPGATLVISGYGVTDPEDQSFDAILHIAETELRRHNGRELLAGGPGLPGACFGDSGGPAYVMVDGAPRAVGVSSRGNPYSAAECGEGSIYTLAPAYIDWLVEATDQEYQPEPEPEPDPEPEAGPEPEPEAGPEPEPEAGPEPEPEAGPEPDGGSSRGAFLASGGGCHAAGSGARLGLPLLLVGLLFLSPVARP